jgi:hypothetical protein
VLFWNLLYLKKILSNKFLSGGSEVFCWSERRSSSRSLHWNIHTFNKVLFHLHHQFILREALYFIVVQPYFVSRIWFRINNFFE